AGAGGLDQGGQGGAGGGPEVGQGEGGGQPVGGVRVAQHAGDGGDGRLRRLPVVEQGGDGAAAGARVRGGQLLGGLADGGVGLLVLGGRGPGQAQGHQQAGTQGSNVPHGLASGWGKVRSSAHPAIPWHPASFSAPGTRRPHPPLPPSPRRRGGSQL